MAVLKPHSYRLKRGICDTLGLRLDLPLMTHISVRYQLKLNVVNGETLAQHN